MRIKYFYIKIIIFLAHTSFASTLSYLEEVTHTSRSAILEQHQRIIDISNKLSFLDCPIELIERQWNRIESAVVGIQYFQEFMRESGKVDPQYWDIYSRCLEKLASYRKRAHEGSARSDAISIKDRENMMNLFSKEVSQQELLLIGTIISKLNQDTICYTKHIAFQLAAFLGGSIGMYQMDCFTPLGRRFMLKGPSFGLGMGVALSLSLPRSRHKNKHDYRFKLYKKPEEDLWRVQHMSTTYALGFGVAIESQPWIHDYRSLVNKEGEKPAVGISFYVEDLHNYMHQKNQSPFYYELITANLLNNLIL